jgi:hypothetical protein
MNYRISKNPSNKSLYIDYQSDNQLHLKTNFKKNNIIFYINRTNTHWRIVFQINKLKNYTNNLIKLLPFELISNQNDIIFEYSTEINKINENKIIDLIFSKLYIFKQ